MAIELLLNITPEMRDCKSKFWRALHTNPICDPEHVSLAAAEQLTKNRKLKGWWQRPGFVSWFCDEHEYETKLASAKFDAVDALLDIVKNPDSPASARVAAAKQIMDHSKSVDKDDSGVEKLLEKIAGVNNVEDLQKFLK